MAGTSPAKTSQALSGHVVASGPVGEVLTPANIRAVYDVEADIRDLARAQPFQNFATLKRDR